MAKAKRRTRARKANAGNEKRQVKKTETKAKVVKATIKQGADVLSCVSKAKLKSLDIFSDGCLLYFTRGTWSAKKTLEESEYGDLPREIVTGFKFIMDRGPIEEITRIGWRAWTFINNHTLPFRGYARMRFVPKNNIDILSSKLDEFEAEYWERVKLFIDAEFDEARKEMKRKFPKWYNPALYPSKQQLRRSFHWGPDFMIISVPDKNSGVLSPEQYKRAVAKEQERIRAFFNDALLVVSAKFLELTTKLRNKLKNQEVFKSATIENLREFIDAFPNLNVTGNKQLANLVKECKGHLDGVDYETVKDSELFARQVGKNMDSVVKEFGKLHDGELLRSIDI